MADKVVRAAGGVLWRRVDGVVQVALVRRPKYGDWSLPKGKLDPGELPVVAAAREVAEETGFSATPGRRLGESRYRVLDKGRDVEKTVQWWAMRADTGAFTSGSEVDALRWLPVPSALARVTAGYDTEPLRAFAAAPVDTTTLLLVRHGSAGSRERWSGPDAARPLDETGQEQAQQLARVLAVYGPQRVLSAPLVRCRDTVRPLAAALGTALEDVDAASEAAGSARPPEGPPPLVALLTALAAEGAPAVVCSQGGVIPEAVEELAAGAGLQVDSRTRKGAFWALTFVGSQLVDADRVARLT